MKIEIYCSMCGKEKIIVLDQKEIDGHISLLRVVESSGWISQQNGPHLDTYCSIQCAA